MADAKAFIELERATPKRQPADERVRHWREFYQPMPESGLRQQAKRCMDCGVPFCQGDSGCPVQNVIPEWNAFVRRGRWREALASLQATNNFPEFTGRLCPAPCESACVLGIVAEPVAIRTLEQSIVDRGFHEGWIVPQPPDFATGKRVAIVGSGPAGLAAAQQLRRRGHDVVVFEKNDRIGGLLRYGIPGFKMEKDVLDRRLAQLRAEGVRFRARAHVGIGPSVEQLRAKFDAILIAVGAEQPRDLSVPGRELSGIALASDYLTQQNRRDAGDLLDPATAIGARDRNVIIIGGGDTGSDCAGTALRQGARTVRQFELLPQPPTVRPDYTPWPLWPMQLRTSHAHEEGCSRDWSVSTTAFTGENGHVEQLHAVRVEPRRTDSGRVNFEPQPGTEFQLPADLVLIAMGFTGPRRDSLLSQLGVELAPNGAIATDSAHQTNVTGVFAAGDARRGASLIVWAIREGRDAADAIDAFLSTVNPSRSLP